MYIIYKKNKSVAKHAPVGTYCSEVCSIGFHPDYADEEAIQVKYKITNLDGVKFDYEEVFWNDDNNERSTQFFDYLEELGVPKREDGLPDLQGFEEEIELKRRKGYRYPVIVKRDPLNAKMAYD